MNPNKIPTRKQMKRFIKKYLPEYGTFGTADKFREIHNINPEIIITRWGDHQNLDHKVNAEFCRLLDKVADRCPGGIYDPSYVASALKEIE